MYIVRKPKKPKNKRIIIVILILILFIAWSFLITRFTPEEITEVVGVKNSYLVTAIAGFLGGTSIFFPFPYYLLVITFAIGGANPYLLGLFTGMGVILGESTSYFVGYVSRDALSDRVNSIFSRISDWINSKPKWTVYILIFLYGSLSPLPNDLLLIPLGIGKYPFWRIIIPLGLGNIVFSTLIAFAGIHGFNLFFV